MASRLEQDVSSNRRPGLPLTQSGPRVDPHVIGGEPFTILAWEEWMLRAQCSEVDGDLFFPSKGENTGSIAKSICNRCGVKDECLEYAVKHHEPFGIWGGLSYAERRMLSA